MLDEKLKKLIATETEKLAIGLEHDVLYPCHLDVLDKR
jgi:hypothetical protein